MADELYSVPDDLGLGATVRGFNQGQRLFDRYILDSILGRGGMGVVWLAVDEKLERHVALKFLPELIKLDSAALDELKRETRRSLELTHPHIVRIHDFVDDATAAAISMEYVDGHNLSTWRVQQPNRVFDVEQIRGWIEQLIEALDYAHRKAKLVHRDLKPANLMINGAGDMKVADFGIARSISDSVTRVTRRGGSSGTLVYMSPQQALGSDPSVHDDIYAFGATLYELLTSKPPFYSGDIMTQVREIVPPSMTQRRAAFGIEGLEIPAAWETTIAACLAKETAERPKTMAQVAALLAQPVAPPIQTKPHITPAPEPPIVIEPIHATEAEVAKGPSLTPAESARRRLAESKSSTKSKSPAQKAPLSKGEKGCLGFIGGSIFIVLALGCVLWLYAQSDITAPKARVENLRQAAANGDVMSQDMLGDIYSGSTYAVSHSFPNYYNPVIGLTNPSFGTVAQDKTQALSWYEKAAEQGDAGAQFRAGQLCEEDPAKRDQAIAWYKKAAAQGIYDASEALRRLGVK